MSSPVITIDNLGKSYRLTHQAERQRYTALRDVIAERAKRLFSGRPARRPKGTNGTEEFWALKDVSLEIKQGEVVGIIGRNGAGKSTLLKILSRITEPTTGRVRIRGRVASLLEVGTGFHPELTGRENIYLNGAILGMTRVEIRRNFDEIVAFAEVENFLDTPVKHYSSGMYVRLAFAVAAHLEPEILIIDEILAVGDAAFQSKCLGRMGEVAKQGRTVLFVSHNMATIQTLCSRSVLLSKGKVEYIGRVQDTITAYLDGAGTADTDLRARTDRQGDQRLIVSGIGLYPASGRKGDGIKVGDDTVVQIDYANQSGEQISDLEVCVGIYDSSGRAITFLENTPLHQPLVASASDGRIRCHIPRLPLVAGNYYLNVHLHDDRHLLDWIQQACTFMVHEGDFFGTGKVTFARLGGVFLDHSWQNEPVPTSGNHSPNLDNQMVCAEKAAVGGRIKPTHADGPTGPFPAC